MVDANGAGIDVFSNDLRRFLKDGGDPSVGPLKVRNFIFLHLIGTIYDDNFYGNADFWTVYPGSKDGRNDALGPFATLAARLFKDRYYEDILIRHTPSIDSGKARQQGIQVFFPNQTDTMRLNEAYLARIRGKRIVVVDDFATRGFSSECARLLLLQAGAAEVIAVNVSKYGTGHAVASPQGQYTWNPCAAITHPEGSFRLRRHEGITNRHALDTIRESYRRVRRLALS